MPGKEKAAAFLETHRYASLVGASMDPLIRANCKNKSGAAVGYLTAELTQVKLAKS